MKIYVEKDERWPDYYLTEDVYEVGSSPNVIEISDIDWLDYQSVCENYNKWQSRLADLYGDGTI